MKVTNYDKLRLDRARNIQNDLANIRPALDDISDSVGKMSSGELSCQLMANKDEYGVNPANSQDINRALGFLAYNDILTLEEEQVWDRSTSRHNMFDPETYDDNLCRMAINYLEEKHAEHLNSRTQDKDQDNVQYNFDDFESYRKRTLPV